MPAPHSPPDHESAGLFAASAPSMTTTPPTTTTNSATAPSGPTGSPGQAQGQGQGQIRRFIIDLPNRPERIRGAYAISNAQIGKTRQDKPYLRCIIGDKTGELPGRMWSIDESTFSRLPTDGFVYIEGETQPYQGELQLIIHTIDPIEPTIEQMRDLLPTSKRSAEDMFRELTGLLATIKHPAMKALVNSYLADQFLMDAFRACPAAKSMHHAYLGGLLEHTLNLVHLANSVCPLYPKINRDLVMVGLFLHDLGKTRELVYDRTFGYSDRGELIGHIVDGAIMLHDKAQQVMRETGMRMPAGVIMVLQHIIISHHGLPEFGAAKVPATPEAILVSLLDNMDAKTTMALAAARPDRATAGLGGNFTEKQWALDTKLFRPDPLG
jgi:3'-5' exoribonuclease